MHSFRVKVLLTITAHLQKIFWLLKNLAEAELGVLTDYNFLILNNVFFLPLPGLPTPHPLIDITGDEWGNLSILVNGGD